MPKMSMSASGDKADLPDPLSNVRDDQSGHFVRERFRVNLALRCAHSPRLSQHRDHTFADLFALAADQSQPSQRLRTRLARAIALATDMLPTKTKSAIAGMTGRVGQLAQELGAWREGANEHELLP